MGFVFGKWVWDAWFNLHCFLMLWDADGGWVDCRSLRQLLLAFMLGLEMLNPKP